MARNSFCMNTPSIFSEKIQRTITCIGAAVLVASVTLYLAFPVVALFFRTTPELFFTSPVQS